MVQKDVRGGGIVSTPLIVFLVVLLLVLLAAYAIKRGKNFSAVVSDGKGLQANFTIQEPEKKPDSMQGDAKTKK